MKSWKGLIGRRRHGWLFLCMFQSTIVMKHISRRAIVCSQYLKVGSWSTELMLSLLAMSMLMNDQYVALSFLFCMVIISTIDWDNFFWHATLLINVYVCLVALSLCHSNFVVVNISCDGNWISQTGVVDKQANLTRHMDFTPILLTKNIIIECLMVAWI